jgi:hypothetical protein
VNLPQMGGKGDSLHPGPPAFGAGDLDHRVQRARVRGRELVHPGDLHFPPEDVEWVGERLGDGAGGYEAQGSAPGARFLSENRREDVPAPHISVRRLRFVAESSAVMKRAFKPS